ncbi:unnamed protein product [Adineta steineri]|uniref:Meckelin n=1 Tax=Adineta steineri TaxID=433720 RepID=A0A813V3X8_9BILA|nr:unnamed protein product [Adineta steineri]CAF0752369.1 unnamed protein product [Adineta steineri]CAF0832323.1 unnamed protein product [Adineta steineri]
MDVAANTRTIWIVFGSLSGVGLILAFIRTWAWYSKSGRTIIDLPTLAKFFLYIMGIVGTVMFLVASCAAVWWLAFYKKEYNNTFESDTNSIQKVFRILLIVSFALKTIDIIHLIIRQATIDIFFIDWERPKAGDINHVSAWRTYFVANEFNEIQTFRRIHVSFHLLFVLFLLKVINLENLALAGPDITLSAPTFQGNYTTEYNRIFRIGIAFPVLLGTGFIQYFFYIIFYQRFIENKIMNFIDLCSVSNISVFILDQNRHGYYIHGRSPHGTTDVNMKDMLMNLERESRMLSGTRGLQANSTEQIFIMKINRTFRTQYDLLFRKYSDFVGPRRSKKDKEHYTDVLLESYRNLNSFLCSYIDHSLPAHEYYVRNRYLVEKLFNYEFQIGMTGYNDSLFFVDNEKTFTEILFYGEENSLFIWNIITFLFIDFLSSNYVLAAIITYLLNLIAVALRNSFGRKNLSKKTLVPRELLI